MRILARCTVYVPLDQPQIVARQIEELYAKSVAILHISHDRATGRETGIFRHFKAEINDCSDRIHLSALYERPADAEVAQEFISSRKNAVLTYPEFSLKADTRMFSKFLVHCSGKGRRFLIIN